MSGGNDAVASEIAAIEATMRSDPVAYRREGLDTRLVELHAAQEAGSPAPAGEAGSEVARIERIMKTDLARYRREGLDKRLLELAAQETDAPAAKDPTPSDGDGLAVPMTLREWKEAGRDPGEHAGHTRLASAANSVLLSLEPPERRDLDASFSRLPEPVQRAALRALASPNAVAAAAFRDADMQAVARHAPLAQLAKEWGREAPARFGRVQARLWAALDRLDDVAFNTALAWLDRLPARTVAAIFRRLAK